MAYENRPIGHDDARTAAFKIERVPTQWQWAWEKLAFCWVPPTFDLTNRVTGATINGTITHSAYHSSFAGGSYISYGDISPYVETYGDVTILAIHMPTSTDQSCLFTIANDASAWAPYALAYSLASNQKYSFWNDNNANGPQSSGTYAVGTRNVIIGRRVGDHANNPTMDIFVNGADRQTQANVPLDVAWNFDSSTPLQGAINRFGGFPGYMGAGSYSHMFIWLRALSDMEIFQLFEDPWGPIKQQNAQHIAYSAPGFLTESLSPDSIAASSNLTGAVTNIDDDPDNPDGLWLTATSATSATSGRFTFPTPSGPPTGQQQFKALLRKTAGTQNPTVSLQLYQGGSLVRELATNQPVASTTGEIQDATWDASELTGVLNGSDVEFGFSSVVGSSASTLGALPAYSAQGTLNYSATMPATVNINVPTHNSGDLLLLLVLCRNTNNNGLLSSINTAGWTQAGGAGAVYGGAQNARIGFGWKIGDGVETTVNITTSGGTTTDARVARVYIFTAANGFAAPPVSNISASNQSGTTASTSISMPTVVPSGSNQLAVTVYASNVVATIGDATGETGGNWTRPVAESPGTANGTIGIQVSDQSGGGTISGGTASVTSSQWVSVGFTLVPATIPGAAVNTIELGALEWNVAYNQSTPSVIMPRHTYYFSRMRM